MPGYPSAPTLVSVTDTLVNVAPAVGNVAGYYVWLVNQANGVIYGPSNQTAGGGSWTIANVPAGSYASYYGLASFVNTVAPPGWQSPGAVPYVVAGISGGLIVGQVLDWGGAAYNAKSAANTGDNSNESPAKGDTNWITDAAITNGLAVLTSPSNGLVDRSGAVLKAGTVVLVKAAGAAGVLLTSTVLASPAPTAGSVTLAANAGATVSGANACFGTDDHVPLQNAIEKQQANGGLLVLPAGNYLNSNNLVATKGRFPTWTTSTFPLLMQGAGMDSTVIVSSKDIPGGAFSYGSGGINPTVGQCDFSDLTLDGNYAGVGNGVVAQPASNPGSLFGCNWPFTGVGSGWNGRFHHFDRVRFYRPSGYGFQASGIEVRGSLFDSCGQPDLAPGGLHYDNIGAGQNDAIVIGCGWLGSSGNYADFLDGGGANHMVRLIMMGCVARNQQIGGIYAGGLGSMICFNRLINMNAGSGIGYDSGTGAGMRVNNIVAWNVLSNLPVNVAGLSFALYGDLIGPNSSSDSTGMDFFAPIQIDLATGFSGNLINALVNAVSKFAVDQAGNVTLPSQAIANLGIVRGNYSGDLYLDANGATGAVHLRANGVGGGAAALDVQSTGRVQGYAATVVKSGITFGTGVPAGGTNQDVYIRFDGGGAGLTHIYYNNAGTWIGIA